MTQNITLKKVEYSIYIYHIPVKLYLTFLRTPGTAFSSLFNVAEFGSFASHRKFLVIAIYWVSLINLSGSPDRARTCDPQINGAQSETQTHV